MGCCGKIHGRERAATAGGPDWRSYATGASITAACRYTYPTAQLFREIREDLIWADGGAVKKATDEAILALLGPKTEADQQARSKKPAKKVCMSVIIMGRGNLVFASSTFE